MRRGSYRSRAGNHPSAAISFSSSECQSGTSVNWMKLCRVRSINSQAKVTGCGLS